ncbi:MAG: TonB C-terminal domain-containing protein [Candidatus Babeliales bacterium]
MLQLKKYFIGSLVFHLVVVVAAFVITGISGGGKSFVVFGAHSRKPSFVLFKNFKTEKNLSRCGVHTRASTRDVHAHAGKKNGHTASKRLHPVAKTSTLHAAKNTKKSPRNVVHERKHHVSHKSNKSPKPKEISIPEREPVIHELSEKISVAHKKSKKHKKHSHQQQKICAKKEETKTMDNDKEQAEEEVLPQAEKVAQPEKITHAEPEKIHTQEAAPIKQELETETALPDDRPLDDIVQVAQAPDASDSSDAVHDYTDFNLIGNYDQKDVILYQRHVQREVDRLWRPPVGVPKGTVCSVLFAVGNDGSIEQFEILKRSDVLIYDLSILRVAKSFQFDKSLWGKQFKIDFRQ